MSGSEDGDDTSSGAAEGPDLREDEIAVLREVFDAFDEDGGGSIDTDELGTAMKTLGAESTRAELEVRLVPRPRRPSACLARLRPVVPAVHGTELVKSVRGAAGAGEGD